MASFIKAIKALCPRLELLQAADSEHYIELVTMRTTLSSGVVKNVQDTELDTLAFLLQEGRPVHTGIAIYTPSMNLDGELEIKVRVDKRLLREVRKKSAFRGKVHNSENIGKSADELVALWNELHPEDVVE